MNRVGSVIVTYNPDLDVIDNVMRISNQSHRVVIVDNGSKDFESLFINIPNNVSIIRLNSNFGIAHAFNIGLVEISSQSDLIATFDQDTKIEPDYFDNLIQQSGILKSDKIGMAVPSFSGIKKLSNYKNLGIRLVTTAISSGSLFKKGILNHIGSFDDKLFIDYVDNEFCLRIISHGYDIVEVTGVALNHSLGNMTPHKIIGFKFHTSNHNSLRRYYIFRNRMHIYRAYALKFKYWFARDIFRNITEPVKIILWETDKIKKIKGIVYGIYDGMIGVYGKREKGI